MIHFHRKLLPKKFWLACSSGVDSISAAHLLKERMGYDVSLWHFNHKLRPQNDEMAKSVRQFGRDFNFPYITDERFGVGLIPDPKGEGEIRDCRIGQMIQSIPKDCMVVTCHHLDDAVESYLMNCFKGHNDYYPMPIETNFGRIDTVKPFLLNPKANFIEYAENNDLMKFVVEDETNTDTKYRRNWIRHDIRPQIEIGYPGLAKVVKKKVLEQYG